MPGLDYITSPEIRSEIKDLRERLSDLEFKLAAQALNQSVTLEFADSGLRVHFSAATPSPPSANTLAFWIYTGAALPGSAHSLSWYSHNVVDWVEIKRDS